MTKRQEINENLSNNQNAQTNEQVDIFLKISKAVIIWKKKQYISI